MRTTTLRSAIAFGLAVSAGAPVHAQTATGTSPTQSNETLTEVIVTGVRESLRSAQQIKQEANQIVDSVQAQDIGKLPDVNTTEALQRITGVQIQRRYGEGATDFDHRTQPAVTVRGLTQVQNFLDGRAVYSASGGRAFDLEGVPPELLAGIDVYKNAPADIIEGGVGGAVNLRTRKPFDAEGQVISATVRGNYYDRVDKDGGATSGLYSNRWDTSVGELGLLVNAVVSKSYYRQDGLLAGPFDTVAPGSIAGAPANAQVPYGFEIYDDSGDRKRLGINTALQWKPNEDLLLTTQYQQTKYWFNRTGAYYYDYNNRSNSRNDAGDVTSYGTDPAPGATFTFNDEGYATSGSLQNQTFETGRFDQELWSQSRNFTVNADWQVNDRLKTTFDVQYLKSYYNADRNGHVLSLYTESGQNGVTSPHHTIVDFDLRGKYPRWNVRDPQLLSDPANYTTPYIVDSLQRNDADTTTLSGAFDYDLGGGFFSALRGGLRYSDNSVELRGTWHGLCVTALGADPSCSAPAGTPLVPLSLHPELAMRGPSKNWFDGNTVPGGLLYPAFPGGGGVREQTGALFDLLGATMKDNFEPGDINSQTEETYTGWLVVDYETNIGSLPIDGGVGVRLVKTEATSSGTQFNPDDTMQPIDIDNSYTRALPSFNLRARLTDTLQTRFVFSKGLARPNFDQLSTNLTLNNPNQVNPVTGNPSASSGNPNLRPIESDNYDLTAEWYFAPAGSVTMGAFYKEVNGFLARGTVTGTFNGIVYDISTNINSGDGTVKGFEFGYQQFFDSLPGLFSGLGMQANYTYVDSSISNPFATPGSNRPQNVPLEKLSKNSYNIMALYEKGPISGRVAYSWRSSYLDQTTGSGANGIPQYAKPYASLDASISYDITDHIAVSFDGVNLNNRMNVLYIGTQGAPLQYQLNDRRYGLSVRVTY